MLRAWLARRLRGSSGMSMAVVLRVNSSLVNQEVILGDKNELL